MKKIFLIPILLITVISFSHIPFFVSEEDFYNGDYYVEDVDMSQIYYYTFDGMEEISFVFGSIPGKSLHILYGIPVGVPNRNSALYFRPSLSVYGPYGNLIDSFDFENSEPELMHEFFGDSYSFVYLRYDEPFEIDGLYRVTLTSEGSGKVWIAFGTREEFTIKQIFEINSMIKDIRNFHDLEGLAAWQRVGLSALILVAFVGFMVFL
ncbi:MAG: hypothetical protein PWQ77_1483 [Kosmotogales bacterium]|nr:hypothetical protein [Kosmotogales bacterium]